VDVFCNLDTFKNYRLITVLDTFKNQSDCFLILYLKIPRIGSPFCTATLLFMRSTAAAPSLTWLAFPAVKYS